MTRRAVLILVALAALIAPAFAQSDVAAARAAAQQRIDTAWAGAVRAGDERLSCARLERELNAIVRTEAVHTHLVERNATPPREASAAFDRFADDALAAEIAAMEEQVDQVSDRVNKLREVALKMQELLPQFARGVRVRDLARARQCRFVRAWRTEAPVAPTTNCGARC